MSSRNFRTVRSNNCDVRDLLLTILSSTIQLVLQPSVLNFSTCSALYLPDQAFGIRRYTRRMVIVLDSRSNRPSWSRDLAVEILR